MGTHSEVAEMLGDMAKFLIYTVVGLGLTVVALVGLVIWLVVK